MAAVDLELQLATPGDASALAVLARDLIEAGRRSDVALDFEGLSRVNGQDVSLYMLEGAARKAADLIAFGHRSRIWILDELLTRIRAENDVWFATHEQVVRYVKEEAGLFSLITPIN